MVKVLFVGETLEPLNHRPLTLTSVFSTPRTMVVSRCRCSASCGLIEDVPSWCPWFVLAFFSNKCFRRPTLIVACPLPSRLHALFHLFSFSFRAVSLVVPAFSPSPTFSLKFKSPAPALRSHVRDGLRDPLLVLFLTLLNLFWSLSSRVPSVVHCFPSVLTLDTLDLLSTTNSRPSLHSMVSLPFPSCPSFSACCCSRGLTTLHRFIEALFSRVPSSCFHNPRALRRGKTRFKAIEVHRDATVGKGSHRPPDKGRGARARGEERNGGGVTRKEGVDATESRKVQGGESSPSTEEEGLSFDLLSVGQIGQHQRFVPGKWASQPLVAYCFKVSTREHHIGRDPLLWIEEDQR